MVFWITALLMCGAAVFLVLFPLSRQTGEETANDGLDLYRAQLAELDERAAATVTDKAGLEADRAEIARRMIRADRALKTPKSGSLSARVPRTIASLMVIGLVPAIGLGLYFMEGSPGRRDVPFAIQQAGKLKDQSVDQLVRKAEQHLEENPNDPRGWEILARVYARLDRPQQQARALGELLRLNGPNATLLTNLGEALTAAQDNVVPARAQALFKQAIKISPKHRKARFYLALSLEQEGRFVQAREIWLALAKLNPKDAGWQSLIAMHLKVAAKNIATGLSGPSKLDVEAAANLSASDRSSMIEGMVERLAGKLKTTPDDFQGWQRLIRSYVVLKNLTKAGQALTQAQTQFDGQSDKMEILARLRRDLDLPAKENP